MTGGSPVDRAERVKKTHGCLVSTDYVPRTKDGMNAVLGSGGSPTKRNPRLSPGLS